MSNTSKPELHQTSGTIKSELLKSSYCIFVSEASENIKNKIKSFSASGLKLLKASFKESLYCIVIPSECPFLSFERDLFNLYKNEHPTSGFWGQIGMGYAGKEWEVVE